MKVSATHRLATKDREAAKVVKYASAHDLRRSFGERWSTRIRPQVLMVLMRHECINTTIRYYVGRNAQTMADAVWAAYARKPDDSGTVLGAFGQNPATDTAKESDSKTP